MVAALVAGLQGPTARTHVVVATGVGGEPQYVDAFARLGLELTEAARARYGVPDSLVLLLTEAQRAQATRAWAVSTRENLEKALGRVAANAAVGDQVLLVLIGHGNGQGEESKFNVPGPDVSGADLARMLAPLEKQKVAVVVAASASGGFVKALSAPGRVVLTATRSPGEANESIFANHFVEALARDVADADKDGRVSMLEAFEYSRREVARVYESDNRMQTEHALLDDDGDGKGWNGAAGGSDGRVARTFALAAAGSTAAAANVSAANDPRVAALVRQRVQLEGRVDSLRRRKAEMKAAEYEQALEALLLDLARTNQQIRRGGTP